MDGDQIASLSFTVSVVFDIDTVVAGVRAGMLVAIHSGTCDVTGALNFQGTDVLTTCTHLELPGLIKLGAGSGCCATTTTRPAAKADQNVSVAARVGRTPAARWHRSRLE
jgi:hypothetical protein